MKQTAQARGQQLRVALARVQVNAVEQAIEEVARSGDPHAAQMIAVGRDLLAEARGVYARALAEASTPAFR